MSRSVVEVTGAPGVHKLLRGYTQPQLDRRIQQAVKAGASVFKAPLKSEASRVSARLSRAVSVRAAKRNKPAAIATFRSGVAFFRHFVIGGTRAHGPRRKRVLTWKGPNGRIFAKRVRGVPPNPIVARVADRYESQAYKAIDRDLDRTES